MTGFQIATLRKAFILHGWNQLRGALVRVEVPTPKMSEGMEITALKEAHPEWTYSFDYTHIDECYLCTVDGVEHILEKM